MTTPAQSDEELAEKWISECEEHHRKKQGIIDDRVQYDSSLRERMKEGFIAGRRHAEQELEAVKREYWDEAYKQARLVVFRKTKSEDTVAGPDNYGFYQEWANGTLEEYEEEKQSNQAQGGE